jgi:hypothetical protein
VGNADSLGKLWPKKVLRGLSDVCETGSRQVQDDHLDRETSVSLDVTETGLEAKSKSRFIAAVDRFGGNLVELMNAPMERKVQRERAVAAGEVELVAAVTKYGVEKLQHDPAFAERASEKYFQRVFERQQNKDGVLLEALEDLRHEPPNQAEAEDGKLDDQFLDRLEHYAESATTEQLRQKWGRVLSVELKKPGTFSAKVMRIVDELDPDTARLFEEFSKHQVQAGVIPKCLSGILDFGDLVRLVSAGLVLDPGLPGHVVEFNQAKTNNGNEVWMLGAYGRAVSVPSDTKPPPQTGDYTSPLQLNDKKMATPVYLLTDVGTAIARIFPANDAMSAYITKLKEALPDTQVTEYVAMPGGGYKSVPAS